MLTGKRKVGDVVIKKSVSLALAVLLVYALCSTPIAFAANSSQPTPDQYNSEVSSYAKSLEEKYQVQIKYPIRSDGYAAIGTATLATLDSTLGYLSPTVVKQLSRFYYETYGKGLTLEYDYLPEDLQKKDIAALGFFSSDDAKIQLFIPTKGANMTLSGNSPFTILHEFGHAYYIYLAHKIGSVSIKKDWDVLNRGFDYLGEPVKADRESFMTSYATVNFEEDFAETFAYSFGCNRDGLGINHRLVTPEGRTTILGKKVEYIQSSFPRYLKDTDQALNTLETMRQTRPFKQYTDLKLSGNSLEYMNFNQPAGVLPNVLASLKIEPVSTEWHWQIGGWLVKDTTGGEYLVFPGCTYVTLKIPVKKQK